jgi:hypothetical protein
MMDRPTIITLSILVALLVAEFIWLEIREGRKKHKKDAWPLATVITTEHTRDKTTKAEH